MDKGLLGAVVNTAIQIGASGLAAHVLGAATSGPDLAARLMAHSVTVIACVALGYVFGAYLTGRVLRQKLPAFKIWPWLMLYGAFGAVIGIVTVVTSPMSGVPAGEPAAGEFAVVAALLAIVVYAALGAEVGAVQAMVLFHAARGLLIWIGFSALAGMTYMILYLTTFYGPGTGLAKAFAVQTSMLAIAVLSSFIMLPALHRLRPC